ncbi:MAG: STAS/SEC14 domain-containing protein [Thermodesulfobacteriota bacterium]
MIKRLDRGSGAVIGFELSGKLHDDDYKVLVPEVEAVIKGEGKVRILLHLVDFKGWDLHAAWDDMKFGVKHYSDFERIAIVGDKSWEEWMARLSAPFTSSGSRFFETHELEDAWSWISSE